MYRSPSTGQPLDWAEQLLASLDVCIQTAGWSAHELTFACGDFNTDLANNRKPDAARMHARFSAAGFELLSPRGATFDGGSCLDHIWARNIPHGWAATTMISECICSDHKPVFVVLNDTTSPRYTPPLPEAPAPPLPPRPISTLPWHKDMDTAASNPAFWLALDTVDATATALHVHLQLQGHTVAASTVQNRYIKYRRHFANLRSLAARQHFMKAPNTSPQREDEPATKRTRPTPRLRLPFPVPALPTPANTSTWQNAAPRPAPGFTAPLHVIFDDNMTRAQLQAIPNSDASATVINEWRDPPIYFEQNALQHLLPTNCIDASILFRGVQLLQHMSARLNAKGARPIICIPPSVTNCIVQLHQHRAPPCHAQANAEFHDELRSSLGLMGTGMPTPALSTNALLLCATYSPGHWVLATIDLATRHVTIFDSVTENGNPICDWRFIGERLASWAQECTHDLASRYETSFARNRIEQLPRRMDCGIWVLMHMRAIVVAGGVPREWPFEPRDGDRLRALTFYELTHAALLWHEA